MNTLTVKCLHERTAALIMTTQIARFMGPTWGPPGSCWPQMGPMLAPWTSLSGYTPFDYTSAVYMTALVCQQQRWCRIYMSVNLTALWLLNELIALSWQAWLGITVVCCLCCNICQIITVKKTYSKWLELANPIRSYHCFHQLLDYIGSLMLK